MIASVIKTNSDSCDSHCGIRRFLAVCYFERLYIIYLYWNNKFRINSDITSKISPRIHINHENLLCNKCIVPRVERFQAKGGSWRLVEIRRQLVSGGVFVPRVNLSLADPKCIHPGCRLSLSRHLCHRKSLCICWGSSGIIQAGKGAPPRMRSKNNCESKLHCDIVTTGNARI